MIGRDEEGDPAVADGRGPVPGCVAGAAEPQGDRWRLRFLDVLGSMRVPGVPQAGDALVQEPPPAVEVDSSPFVLLLVAADAEPEDEAATREELERRRLLRHGGSLAQGQLQHAGPEGRSGRRHRGHGQRRQCLADRVRPVEVVYGPQRIGAGALGPAAQLHQLSRTVGITKGITAVRWKFSQRGGGEDEPEGWAGNSTSYRGHTDILRRCRRPFYSETASGPTDPVAPPGRSRTDTVQRASQMARPSSSVRAIRQTCTVLPTLIGVASAVRCPSRTERR